MDIQESKAKLQSLYDDLKKEVNGSVTTTGVVLPPTSGSFYMKAKAVVDEEINLSIEDNSIAIEHILHTFDKEVSCVKDFEGKRRTVKKCQEELESLMRKATRQFYIDLCPFL